MDNFKGNRMVNIPDKFGTNLPASYRNLVGLPASDFGGYDNMPQYLRDLLMSSQVAASDAAAGASSPASPTAAAQGAGNYAQIRWQGNRGMAGIPQFKGNITPTYQIPVEQLADLMKSGLGSNYEAMGTFADGQSIAPKMNLATYTDPLTGEMGKHLISANKTDGLGYRTTGGTYLPENAAGWQFTNAAASTPKAEEAAPAAQAATTAASNPYVLNQTPDAFKYAKGGLVDENEEDMTDDEKEIWRLIQRSKANLKERQEMEKGLRPLSKEALEERKKEELNDMWPQFAKGGLVEMGEELRDKGRMGDSILAHISPDEARMLKMMGGAGTINPETGLPEYFSFKKLLGAALPIIGNAIAPGIGGILGGAAGGALSGGGLEGALMGAAGAGLGNLGGSVFGGAGGGGGGFSLGNLMSGLLGGSSQDKLQGGADYDDLTDDQRDFMETQDAIDLFGGGKGGMDWKKAAALGGLGLAGVGAYANRNQGKKNDKMLREQEAERQRKQDEENKSFRELIESQQPRTFTPAPADYYTYGSRPEHKYFSDYGPISMPTRQFASGGYVGEDGLGGGQDDTIPARLSNNEYVIPADVVAHLGDGTPKQGAKKLDKMIGNVRKHKAVKGHPPKSKPVKAYVGGLG